MRLTRDDYRRIALRVINYGMNTNWLLINSTSAGEEFSKEEDRRRCNSNRKVPSQKKEDMRDHTVSARCVWTGSSTKNMEDGFVLFWMMPPGNITPIREVITDHGSQFYANKR